MEIHRFAIAALMWGVVAMTLIACGNRSATDDRIGQVCVSPSVTGERDPRLDADVEIVLTIYLEGGGGDCISSTSFSRVPKVESSSPTRWRVVGGFVDASADRPRTPDCNGGVVVATLGRLTAGSYAVESSMGELEFELPSEEESPICALQMAVE